MIPEPCVATIGFFDGVHMGHRYLIQQVKEIAAAKGLRSALVTFPVHPRKVMNAAYHPELLTTPEEKTNLLAGTGVDYCLMLDFTPDISRLTAKEFMTQILKERFQVKYLVIGYDHRFGHNRSEGFDDYVRYGQAIGIEVIRAQAYTDDIQIDTAVKEIVAIDVEDGIVFEYKGIEPIREEDAYNNFRVHLQAKYGKIDSPMKIDVTTGDAITPAAIQYDFPMLFEEKSIPVMAYTLETVLAEKYETIIRRNIGSTRARDYYDLHTLYRSRKSSVRPEILKAAVLHTAMKRDSVQDMQDWKEILKDIREEPAMYLLWDNYVAENKYIRELEFHIVLDTVEEVAKLLDL